MKLYVKVTKDGKQVFEGWSNQQAYQDFYDNVDNLTEYDATFKDYEGVSNCGTYLVNSNNEIPLYRLDKLLNRLENLDTAEDFYLDLNDISDIFYDEYYDFDEDMINEFFSTPYETLRACFFGKVHFTDDYFKINAYGNIETTSEIPYDDYDEAIIERWIEENL